MGKTLVRIFAVIVVLLAVIGLFINEGLFLGFMNVDIALDILRLGLAVVLIYAGFISKNPQTVKWSLILFTVLYLGLGVFGLVDAKIWGLLPTGLTGFDIVFHLGAGVLGLIAVLRFKDDKRS